MPYNLHEAQGGGAGGFLSPPASIASTAATNPSHTLPHPRATPLRPGGSKESTFIRHVDTQILHIQRRFAKRTTPSSTYLSDIDRDQADAWGDVRGYSSMREACHDINALLRIIWISGTPSLQVPYLIALAMLVANFIQAMPPTPRALFRTLRKLDVAFASLLTGRDVETEIALPGFERGKGVSGTEKVRIRSLVERTRVSVVESFKRGEFEFEGFEEESDDRMDIDEATNAEQDGELIIEGEDLVRSGGDDEEEDSWDMQIARVYDRTVVELGGSLEEPSIGIITEERG